jgi:hypothetical protein
MRELDGKPVWEITEQDGQQRLYASWAVYTPVARTGEDWLPIADRQPDLWTACMIAAAAFWKAHPGSPLDRLEEGVNAAVWTLRETSQTFAWIGDDEHLVRRTIYVFDVALDQLPSVFRRRVFPVRPMPRSGGGELGPSGRH